MTGAGTSTHYNDVTISAVASQITSLAIVHSTVYSGADQRKYQSSASLAFLGGIHRWPVNSLRKGPVTRKMFPFDDVIMEHGTHFWLPTLFHAQRDINWKFENKAILIQPVNLVLSIAFILLIFKNNFEVWLVVCQCHNDLTKGIDEILDLSHDFGLANVRVAPFNNTMLQVTGLKHHTD